MAADELPVGPRPVTPRGVLLPGELHTVEIFENASPSVAFITTLLDQRDRFMRVVGERRVGSGSGFIWDASGHIVAINDQSINTPDDLFNTLERKAQGEAVWIEIIRNAGERLTRTMTLGPASGME